MGHFNPPAPCGAGPIVRSSWRTYPPFQSTRPLRGGTRDTELAEIRRIFQSTRPLRGGTAYVCKYISKGLISIHPPLAGRDQRFEGHAAGAANFNPPAPCGAGPAHQDQVPVMVISIHPPLAGRDSGDALAAPPAPFQSTRPLRGGTKLTVTNTAFGVFQSTRPLRGGTWFRS